MHTKSYTYMNISSNILMCLNLKSCHCVHIVFTVALVIVTLYPMLSDNSRFWLANNREVKERIQR